MSPQRRDGGRRAPGAKAADDAAELSAQQRAQEIYRGILRRAPEHDFEPTLDRVRDVCDLLGGVQRAYPVIHITGTNGKTSTARMVERLARELGLRTGRFTSPHLTNVRERIAIDGEPISARRFVEVWDDVEPYIQMVDERSREAGGPRLSFFEVFTVMALAAFADAPVNVAIIEVGMGGRWDATNVVDGAVAVLTPIARDHERWLGHELTQIAHEKAGIVKDGATVVIAEQDEQVAGVLAAAVHEHAARVVVENRDIAVASRELALGGQVVSLQGMGGLYTDVFLPLHGEHQAHNALLALAAVEAFLGGGALAGDVVEQAFASVDSPGRLEVVRRSPTVLVDAAHNIAGVEALVAALEEAFAFRRLVGIVGLLADKDAEGILAGLEPVLDDVVVSRSASDRAMDVDVLAEVARDVFGEDRVHVAERLDDAIDLAVGLAEADGESQGTGVVATGSITVIAEVRQLLGRP
jgi:dihydrofolate synthase/folylpolyglutamate synthase